MTFPQAKKEFETRYYHWAQSEWEKEIEQSFPNLRKFKSGSAWKTYQYMQQLGKREQLILARGLLKRFHSNAVKTLGDTCSPDEETFRWRRDNFFTIREQYGWVRELEESGQALAASFRLRMLRGDAIKLLGKFDPVYTGPIGSQYNESLLSQLANLFKCIPQPYEEEIAARRKSGEKVRFVGKRKIQEALMESFRRAFEDQYTSSDYDDIGDPWSSYAMPCCGWILHTHFWFGRQRNLIEYSHGIASPSVTHHPNHPDITAPAMVLAQSISLCAWLGLTSMTKWEYLKKDDLQGACTNSIENCRHFFGVAPKLLAGLEFEKITPE